MIHLFFAIVGLVFIAVAAACVPLALLYVVALRAVRVVWHEGAKDFCRCGYELAGLPSAAVCPECGQTWEQSSKKLRLEYRWRPFAFFFVILVLSPSLTTSYAAEAGLLMEYKKYGLEPAWALECAKQDFESGSGIRLTGVLALIAVCAHLRRHSNAFQLIALGAGSALWVLGVAVLCRLDAHHRGLDVTDFSSPWLQAAAGFAVILIVIGSVRAHWFEPVQTIEIEDEGAGGPPKGSTVPG